MAIECYLAGDARRTRGERLAEERLGGGEATIATEQEVDGLAVLVDGAIQIVPLGFDRDVRLIDTPRRADHPREPVPALLKFWDVSRDPPEDRAMRDLDAALRHHLDQIPIRKSIGDVPTHAQLNDVRVEGALAVNRVAGYRLRHSALLHGPRILPDAPECTRTIQGGFASNVIAEDCVLRGTFRCRSAASRHITGVALRRICEGVCLAMGARCDIKLSGGTPALVNDGAVLDAVLGAIARQFGERPIVPVPGKFQSEDFSFISERVPGCQLLIGSCMPGRVDQLHSAFYDPDERCIGIGAAAIARVALDLLAAELPNKHTTSLHGVIDDFAADNS